MWRNKLIGEQATVLLSYEFSQRLNLQLVCTIDLLAITKENKTKLGLQKTDCTMNVSL